MYVTYYIHINPIASSLIGWVQQENDPCSSGGNSPREADPISQEKHGHE